MKILIVDNNTEHINELRQIFSGELIVCKKENLIKIDTSHCDLIIFSGGSNVPTVLNHPEYYRNEILLCQNTSIPILGICLGNEIITSAFGGKLKISEKHQGAVVLKILDTNLERILHTKHIETYEGHSVSIEKIPDNFVVCAQSDHGPEIIRHVNKPIIGIQFHPEINPNQDLLKWILETLSIK